MKKTDIRKRGLIFLLVFTLLFGLSTPIFSVAAASGETMELSVDTATAMPKNTVQVSIRLASNPGLASLKLDVAYDSFLTLETVTFDTAFGAYVLAPTPYTNPQTLSFISPLEENDTDGIFATLTFLVSEEAPDNYEAKISVDCDGENTFDGDLAPVSVTAQGGAVHIIHGIPGDIDGDRKVNNKDAILLFRYVAGGDVAVDEFALDVNCDGRVNNKDAITLFRYVAGWDVQIGRGDPCDLGHDYVDGVCTRCGDVDESSTPDVPVESSQGLAFTSNGDGTCYVSGIGSCVDSDIVIPSVSPTGEMVTRIGDKAFCGQKSISSVVIPEGVTGIGYYSFQDCVNMTSARLPKSLYSISSFAFQRCSSLADIVIPSAQYFGSAVFEECDSLQSVTIPDGISSLGDDCFNHCDNLTSVILPNSLTKIGDRAFRDCCSLTELTIPEGVTSIGYYTFENCSSLTRIILPDGITDINDKAFRNCESLTGFTTPSSLMNVGFMVFEGCEKLIQKENGVAYVDRLVWDCDTDVTNAVLREDTVGIIRDAFNGCSKLESITLPEGLRFVGSWAFNGCDQLTHIEIPQSMTSIGYAAFYGCHGLKSIDIHDRVTDIGAYAFYDCTQLTSVIYPDGCEVIGHFTFYNCQSLTSISIPNSLKLIEPVAFDECTKLTDIYYRGTEAEWEEIEKSSSPASLAVTIHFIGEDNDPDSPVMDDQGLEFTSLHDGTCYVSSVEASSATKIVVPEFSPTGDRVIYVDKDAFSDLESVEQIILSEGIERIGDSAFINCGNLKVVVLPSTLTRLGAFIFHGCDTPRLAYPGTQQEWEQNVLVCSGNEAVVSQIIFEYSGNWEDYEDDFGSGSIVVRPPSDGKGSYELSFESNGDGTCKLVDVAYSGYLFGDTVSIAIPETSPQGDTVTAIGAKVFDSSGVFWALSIPNSIIRIEQSAFADCHIDMVIYLGLENEWKSIVIEPDNDRLTNANVKFLDDILEDILDGSLDDMFPNLPWIPY